MILQFFIIIKITPELEQLFLKSNSLLLRVIEKNNDYVTSKNNSVTSNFLSLYAYVHGITYTHKILGLFFYCYIRTFLLTFTKYQTYT